MRTAKILALSGTIIMFLTLMYGFIFGEFFKEGSVIGDMAWGKVSLVDVYIGFFLFSGWVIYREQKRFNAVLWIISILILGNFITCLYTTLTLYRSKDDWIVFWLGEK